MALLIKIIFIFLFNEWHERNVLQKIENNVQKYINAIRKLEKSMTI